MQERVGMARADQLMGGPMIQIEQQRRSAARFRCQTRPRAAAAEEAVAATAASREKEGARDKQQLRVCLLCSGDVNR